MSDAQNSGSVSHSCRAFLIHWATLGSMRRLSEGFFRLRFPITNGGSHKRMTSTKRTLTAIKRYRFDEETVDDGVFDLEDADAAFLECAKSIVAMGGGSEKPVTRDVRSNREKDRNRD